MMTYGVKYSKLKDQHYDSALLLLTMLTKKKLSPAFAMPRDPFGDLEIRIDRQSSVMITA